MSIEYSGILLNLHRGRQLGSQKHKGREKNSALSKFVILLETSQADNRRQTLKLEIP